MNPEQQKHDSRRHRTKRASRASVLFFLPWRWIIAGLAVSAASAPAQEALRTYETRQVVPGALRLQQDNPDYFLKWHDIRFQARPSLSFEWNDNIAVSEGGERDDYIIRPMLDLSAVYPITSWNVLRVSVGIGYDKYVNNDDWSQIRLEQRSAVEFDFMVSNWRFNIHDRFEHILDPAREASFAGPGRYGGLENTAGISATWPLQKFILTLAYDHYNFWSSFSDTDYLDRSTELPLARAGYQFLPTLTAGIEGTYTYSTYDQPFLNDYTGYSAGAYADWQPGQNLRVQPRAGYAQYFYKQTSLAMRAEDQGSWYAGISASHLITDTISYSLSAGHELRPGTYGDNVENWYVTPSVSWKLIRNVALNTSLSYETGEQSSGSRSENFDWIGASLGITYQFLEKLSTGLNYRHTIRSSDAASRDYSQNVVTLTLSYRF